MVTDSAEFDKRYGMLVSVLVALDDNFVTNEEYELTKDWDINSGNGFKRYLDIILTPSFLRYTCEKRDEILKSIKYAINGSDECLNKAFKEIEFFFHYEIENNRRFLRKLEKEFSKL